MTNSFKAGMLAAETGNNINNSYPFDHEEFVAGYKSVKPEAKTMLDQCKTPEDKLRMLRIIEMTKHG